MIDPEPIYPDNEPDWPYSDTGNDGGCPADVS